MLEVYVDDKDIDRFSWGLDYFSKNAVRNSLNRLAINVRAKLVKNSPVGIEGEDEHPGLLKRSWKPPEITGGAGYYTATITNTTNYSADVNNGHYQPVGQYVPAIHARLVHYYVPGLYFAEQTLDEMGYETNSILSSEMLRQWDGIRTNYYDVKGEELAGLR